MITMCSQVWDQCLQLFTGDSIKRTNNDKVSVDISLSETISTREIVKCSFPLVWICLHVCMFDHGWDGVIKVTIYCNLGGNTFMGTYTYRSNVYYYGSLSFTWSGSYLFSPFYCVSSLPRILENIWHTSLVQGQEHSPERT